MQGIIVSSMNLLILIGLLVYKLRLPVMNFVSQRHHSLREEIQQVRDQLQQAQEQYDEFSAKLKAIDVEIATLREQTKQDTLVMKQRVINETRRMSSIVVSDARNSADALFSELKGQLYSDWSMHVLEKTEALLRERLTRDDRARIRHEFSQQVEYVQ